MKIGEIKVIDERFVSGSPAVSWDEFLVLERLFVIGSDCLRVMVCNLIRVPLTAPFVFSSRFSISC